MIPIEHKRIWAEREEGFDVFTDILCSVRENIEMPVFQKVIGKQERHDKGECLLHANGSEQIASFWGLYMDNGIFNDLSLFPASILLMVNPHIVYGDIDAVFRVGFHGLDQGFLFDLAAVLSAFIKTGNLFFETCLCTLALGFFCRAIRTFYTVRDQIRIFDTASLGTDRILLKRLLCFLQQDFPGPPAMAFDMFVQCACFDLHPRKPVQDGIEQCTGFTIAEG